MTRGCLMVTVDCPLAGRLVKTGFPITIVDCLTIVGCLTTAGCLLIMAGRLMNRFSCLTIAGCLIISYDFF